MKKLFALAALVVATAAFAAPPLLQGAPASETHVTAAAHGVFPPGTSFAGRSLDDSWFGLGVVVGSGGSAVGGVQISLNSLTGSLSLDGTVTRGTVQGGDAVTLSGTATLYANDNALKTALPFSTSLTKTGVTFTIAGTTLRLPSLRAGSIYIGPG